MSDIIIECEHAKQGLIQDFEIGGEKKKKNAISACAEVRGSRGMPPQENFEKWAL